jgi:hypothetical protein
MYLAPATLALHWTTARAANQVLTVRFKGKKVATSSQNRLSVVENSYSCGDTGKKKGSSVNNVFNDQGGNVLASTTVFSSLAATATRSLQSNAHDDNLSVTIASQPKAAGKLKLCLCDFMAEMSATSTLTECGSSAETFGAWLGYFHVVGKRRPHTLILFCFLCCVCFLKGSLGRHFFVCFVCFVRLF